MTDTTASLRKLAARELERAQHALDAAADYDAIAAKAIGSRKLASARRADEHRAAAQVFLDDAQALARAIRCVQAATPRLAA